MRDKQQLRRGKPVLLGHDAQVGLGELLTLWRFLGRFALPQGGSHDLCGLGTKPALRREVRGGNVFGYAGGHLLRGRPIR